MNKELVTLVIEKALLNVGKEVYDKVIEKLKVEYNCALSDCYRHPNYLISVFEDVFGNSADTVVESIKKELKQFKRQKEIAVFLDAICQ